MRFLIMTDIEGVTGVTTYQQAENSQFGKDMLMNDLLAVIDGIRNNGKHEIIVYDMHTDGRNVDMSRLPEDVQTVVGKPINSQIYKGIGGYFDGLFLVGLHAMAREPMAMLAHSYLVQYDSIHVNDMLVGEIGVETLLAGEQGTPLVFVSGDDMGCKEAEKLIPGIVAVAVKKSLGDAQAICLTPARTYELLKTAAEKAAAMASAAIPQKTEDNVSIRIKYSQCRYLNIMKEIHPEIFVDESTAEVQGKGMLKTWSRYLELEREMLSHS